MRITLKSFPIRQKEKSNLRKIAGDIPGSNGQVEKTQSRIEEQQMIQDLHSHTYYSFCGGDKPEEIVEAAIAGGIELFGITDHNYGIGNARTDLYLYRGNDIGENYERTLTRYYDHINLIKEKYADQIRVLRGIEVATMQEGRIALPDSADISFFDYCLVENLDLTDISVAHGDLFSFAKPSIFLD